MNSVPFRFIYQVGVNLDLTAQCVKVLRRAAEDHHDPVCRLATKATARGFGVIAEMEQQLGTDDSATVSVWQSELDILLQIVTTATNCTGEEREILADLAVVFGRLSDRVDAELMKLVSNSSNELLEE